MHQRKSYPLLYFSAWWLKFPYLLSSANIASSIPTHSNICTVNSHLLKCTRLYMRKLAALQWHLRNFGHVTRSSYTKFGRQCIMMNWKRIFNSSKTTAYPYSSWTRKRRVAQLMPLYAQESDLSNEPSHNSDTQSWRLDPRKEYRTCLVRNRLSVH